MSRPTTFGILGIIGFVAAGTLLSSNIFRSIDGVSPGRVNVFDNTPPRVFHLLSPANGITIWDDKPTVHWKEFAQWYHEHNVHFADRPVLSWQASVDEGSGLDCYELWVDGKLLKTLPPNQTNYACMVGQRQHEWYVVAVDKVGNRRRSAETFTFEYKLSRTPPMGFNTWSHFRWNINERLIKEIADAMVSSGMRDVGYQYVNLDDGYGIVGGKQIPKPSPRKFPHGMKALADYIHSKGLKFGIYARGVPEKAYQDMVDEFVEWGVDYLKYDSFCKRETEKHYLLLRQLLADSGRPIFLSISFKSHNPFVPGLVGCEGSYAHNPSELPNAWRTGSDLHGKWVEVLRNIDQQVGLADGHGLLDTTRWMYPGYWNDPDILEVGNPGLTVSQSRAMFSMWCILSAPLLAGNDLRNMDDTIRKILTNREAIMVNQDPRGIFGRLVARDMKANSWQVWAKPLIPGPWQRWEPYDRQKRVAVVLFNRSNTKAQRIAVKWTDIGLEHKPAVVRDIWQHKNLGVFENSFSALVPPCDVVMVIISTIDAS